MFLQFSRKLAKCLPSDKFNKIVKLNFCKKEDKSKVNAGGISVRYNFHPECEEGLNDQINCELCASYSYFCMSCCLSRPDVALLGYAGFFAASSREEQHHAQQLAQFVNMRGGTVVLSDVHRPDPNAYHGPEVALEESILLEKSVLKSLEELHRKAAGHGDVALTDYLESSLIPEQYRSLAQLAGMLARAQRAGPGPGLVLLDLDLQRHPPDLHGRVKD